MRSKIQSRVMKNTVLTRVMIKNMAMLKAINTTRTLTRARRSNMKMHTKVMRSTNTMKNMSRRLTTLERSTPNRNSKNKRLSQPPCKPRKTEHPIPLVTR